MLHGPPAPCTSSWQLLDKADEATDRKLARHLVALYGQDSHATAKVGAEHSWWCSVLAAWAWQACRVLG